jgi:AcrR family transcriptional regulator
MKTSGDDDQPKLGLRERKKAKTRASIQEHALRLFHEKGYEATTVEEIAEAAEVSPSTFFRYFPTKEEVVLYDAFDPLLFESFRAQPPDLTTIQALRRALKEVFGDMPYDQLDSMRERGMLMFSVPELRAAMMDQVTQTIMPMVELVAERVGRPPDDFEVLVLIGAMTGAMFAAMLPALENPTDRAVDFYKLMDRGLELLEAGLPV